MRLPIDMGHTDEVCSDGANQLADVQLSEQLYVGSLHVSLLDAELGHHLLLVGLAALLLFCRLVAGGERVHADGDGEQRKDGDGNDALDLHDPLLRVGFDQ